MAFAALTARLLKPWKPISDHVRCSKWAGQGPFFFFWNGSLACNIIRNTLGHHLIFLQCDHMRKFVLMQRAQVWLVTLSLSLRVLLSLSLSAVSQSVLSGLSSLHAQRALAVFPRQTRQHSLMGHANTQHTYYICMNGVFLCLWSRHYWIHTEGTTHTRDKVHWPFLFRVFFSSWCCIDRVICGLSHVSQFIFGLWQLANWAEWIYSM